MAILWSVAGGVLVGGFLVAAMTLAGRLSAGGLFLTTTALFAVGAVLGFLHGGMLGFLGRPQGVSPGQVGGRLAMAALYTVPALAVAWVITGWIGMTVVVLYLEGTGVLIGTGAAWILGAAVLALAAWDGRTALQHAFARWESRKAGSLLVGATFVGLLVSFLAYRPRIWGFWLEVNEVGAVLLAAGITLWIVGPLVTGALWLVRRIPGPEAGFGGSWKQSLIIGGVVGLVLALVALPFHEPPLAAPAVTPEAGLLTSVVLALSQALVDEVLLRLGVMTGVVWLLLRWSQVERKTAAALAVGAAALLQAILYTPQMLGVGFPTVLAGAGYLLVGVLVPAVAFGLLYWYRGLGTAVVADATLLTAVALLV